MTLVIDGEPPSISAARSRRPVAWPGIARDRVGGIGALGGEAIGSFVFTSGQALRFDVGGNGGGCATPDAPNGGTNGGGSGGSGCAGGGGGATDVRVGACAATATCGTSSAIIVAGGGGKATDNDEGQGGAGGGPNGANGTAGHNGAGTLGGGGQGATQSAGGPGGIGGVGSLFPNPSPSGGDGTTLQGGVGGHDGCSGGGGGGGVFGGGGGGSAGGGNGCGGGGGGSSFVSTSGTNVSFNSNVAGTLGGGVITITFLYDTITTSKPSAPSVRTSTPVTDTVTVSRNGTDVPTGNISFNVCGPLTGPSECTSAAGTTVGSPVSLKPNHDACSLVYALEAMRGSLTQKIATARSQLEEAQADLAKIRWRLDCCTVRRRAARSSRKASRRAAWPAAAPAFASWPTSRSWKSKWPFRSVTSTRSSRASVSDPHRGLSRPCLRRRRFTRDAGGESPESAIPIRVKISVPQEEEGVYLKPEMIARVSFLRGGDGEPGRSGCGVVPVAASQNATTAVRACKTGWHFPELAKGVARRKTTPFARSSGTCHPKEN